MFSFAHIGWELAMCQAQRFERLAHGHRARVRQTQNSDPDLPCSCFRSLLAVLNSGKWKLKLRSDYTLWLLEWGDWLWALGDLFPLLSPFHHLQSTRQLVSFFWNTFHPVSPCSRWIGAWQVTGSAAITSPREAAGLLMSPLECPWASPRAPLQRPPGSRAAQPFPLSSPLPRSWALILGGLPFPCF